MKLTCPFGKIDATAPLARRILRRYVLPAVLYLLILAILFVSLVCVVSASVKTATKPYMLTRYDARELLSDGEYDCILVLGAGLQADGSPSPMLYDRVKVACGLYAAHPETPLLMSGDHSGYYNEVGAMKTLATEEFGAASEDVFLDHEGYSTYESIYRAREMFGARRVLIVTQEYHLYRALYIAGSLGLDAVGVAADERPYTKRIRRETREIFATYKDMFLSEIGEDIGDVDASVDLDGNGDLT